MDKEELKRKLRNEVDSLANRYKVPNSSDKLQLMIKKLEASSKFLKATSESLTKITNEAKLTDEKEALAIAQEAMNYAVEVNHKMFIG